jgi:GR25 family glycosyltransferase involved in LPS biosynthesis
MHAEALSVSAGECDFCIILEDDSIINADVILSELKSIIEFLKLNKRSIVFFSETNVRIKKTIEDLVQKNKKFISVKPSISRGAGAYIVHRSIAINLCEYIKTKNIPLPIDMLITFWALENKILSYWVSKPFVIEGSGRVYKSSLR